jgi:hypothetical protein
MVGVDHVEVEGAQPAHERRAEREREREVRVRGGRQGWDAEDSATPVVGPGHPGRDHHHVVPQRLETSPDRLDGGGHAAEHREVVVREETDPQTRGRVAGYILYRPKSSGFRFSSHSLSFS